MVYLLAIGAAFFLGAGSVVQQRAASEAPPEDALSFKLLLWLARRRLWLGGVGIALIGNLLAALALGAGSVALVEPLFVIRLLFALPLAAAWVRRSVPARDWGGAVATAAGLAIFVLVGQPHQSGLAPASELSWVIAGGTIVALALALTVVGKRLDAVREAALLAGAAGVLFGLQGAMTHSAIQVLRAGGVVGLATTWQPYAIISVAILGMVLIQSAYQAAPLPASFPSLVAAEPLAGIAVGAGILGGVLRLAPASLAGVIGGVAIMVGGIYLLASSPLITGQLDLLERRHEEGLAYRTEEQLDHDLRTAHRELDLYERHYDLLGSLGTSRRHLERHVTHIEEQIARLRELEDDIERRRRAEREHVRDRPRREQEEFDRRDRELDARQREIDARARTLRERSLLLEKRVAELTGRPSDETR